MESKICPICGSSARFDVDPHFNANILNVINVLLL